MTALLIVNLAFGVMSRAAPAFNLFAIGLPVSLVFGLVAGHSGTHAAGWVVTVVLALTGLAVLRASR